MLILTECMLEHNSFYNHHHHHHHCIESIDRKFLIDWIIEILFHINGNVKRTIIGATTAGTGSTISTAFDTSSATTASELRSDIRATGLHILW